MSIFSSLALSDPFFLGLFCVYVIVMGLCMGSFASAIAYRAARRQSWIFSEKKTRAARSFCPRCYHQLNVWDLIPFFSWCFLRGKCRYCHERIGVFYPLIELVAAAILLVYFLFVGRHEQFFVVILFCVFLPFVLANIAIVIREWALPPVSLLISGLLSFGGMVFLVL